MENQIDVRELLSTAAMRAQKAENYPPGTYVVDLAELPELIAEMIERELRTHD
jgi:hypothetical protein